MTSKQSERFIQDIESKGFDYYRWDILLHKQDFDHEESIEMDFYENILQNTDFNRKKG